MKLEKLAEALVNGRSCRLRGSTAFATMRRTAADAVVDGTGEAKTAKRHKTRRRNDLEEKPIHDYKTLVENTSISENSTRARFEPVSRKKRGGKSIDVGANVVRKMPRS